MSIIDVEFDIDTGRAQPVCCPNPSDGLHESEIMREQLAVLEKRGWIMRYEEGAWGSSIVLAPKPHQEDVHSIDDFIWRLCVSYRSLNSVTLPFRIPIPVCNDALDRIGTIKHRQLFFISFDANSGYHQISCTRRASDKLAFFGPDFQKWTWTVMPFGPRNGPAVYITFMNEQIRTWFQIARHTPLLNEAFIDCCQIIDDTLMWSDHPNHLVAFFCIALDCLQSYRVSLKLSKCNFFTNKTEFLGYDVSSGGIHPAQSKFALILNYPLPTTKKEMLSFIGFGSFYSRYIPWFEVLVKPLRRLASRYSNASIPFMAYSPSILRFITHFLQVF